MQRCLLLIGLLQLVISGVKGQTQFDTSLNTPKKHPDSLYVRVIVKFKVTKKGDVKHVSVYKIEGDSCDEKTIEGFKKEAIRVVSNNPKLSKKPTNEYYSLPILFVTDKK
jgi:hypothetical protein